MTLTITEIRIRRTFEGSELKALVSVTFDSCFVLHEIKIIKGSERLFVAMPSRRDEKGIHRDIAHPIISAFRAELEQAILEAYERHMQEKKDEVKNCKLG
jgi:stage V sporulation protein G